MLTAILTDIHANREALTAVLADAAAHQAESYVLLGDLVGYGPDPEYCLDLAMDLVAKGAVAIRGNHDQAIYHPDPHMTAQARQAIDWTRPRLSDHQIAFLRDLPLTHQRGEMLFTHASAHLPGDFAYITSDTRAIPSFRATKARLIFVGHTHRPALFSCDHRGQVREQMLPASRLLPLLPSRRWLAVIGSTGQPRDGAPLASYGLYDSRTAELRLRRLPYQAAITAQKIRALGLPEGLAQRLLTGV